MREIGVTTRDIRTRPELLNKVPEVTIFFWIIKMMSTTVARREPTF